MMDDVTNPPEEKKSHIVSLLACATLCYLVAFIGSQGTFQGLQGWYQAVNKPSITPPSWIFAPVWTVLYALMSISLWQIWRAEPSKRKSLALIFFAVQLVLNGLWSWIFFAWQKLPLAFGEVVLLDCAILATIVVANKVRASASLLLIPYLAWTLFATLLTYGFWKANPSTATEGQNIKINLDDQSPTATEN